MTVQYAHPSDIDSRKAAWRLLTTLWLMLLGNSGMYAVSVVLPAVQAEFGISRAQASIFFDISGSYHAAFINGVAWNALNMLIVWWLYKRWKHQAGAVTD